MKENNIEGADLSQVVETIPSKTTESGQEIEVPMIKEPKYEDPIDDNYKIQRDNRSPVIENMETEEAIEMRHKSIHSSAKV